MKINNLVISSLLAIMLSSPVLAKDNSIDELASPIIALMPVFKEIRDELKINDEQAKTIDEWLAEAPTKKKELQQQVLAVRAELREALLARVDRAKREEIKLKLSEANNRLIVMSSLCARVLHKTLTKEQYSKVVAKYKESTK